MGRELGARVLGHPATAVAATALAIALPVTLCVELVRFHFGVPRPVGASAQLCHYLGSAWRGAEFVSGAGLYVYFDSKMIELSRSDRAASPLLRFLRNWMRGEHHGNRASRVAAGMGTALFCGGCVAAVHHFVQRRLRERLMHAAERVLDMDEW